MDKSIEEGKLKDFWEGKEPCWILLDCSKLVYQNCSAYHYRERPCWEIAYTQCEILLGIKRDCKSCKVFKLYQVSEIGNRSIIPSREETP